MEPKSETSAPELQGFPKAEPYIAGGGRVVSAPQTITILKGSWDLESKVISRL